MHSVCDKKGEKPSKSRRQFRVRLINQFTKKLGICGLCSEKSGGTILQSAITERTNTLKKSPFRDNRAHIHLKEIAI